VLDYNSRCVLRNKAGMLYNCLFTFSSLAKAMYHMLSTTMYRMISTTMYRMISTTCTFLISLHCTALRRLQQLMSCTYLHFVLITILILSLFTFVCDSEIESEQLQRSWRQWRVAQ